jgi:transitional endoplasmic reticulum ATPase
VLRPGRFDEILEIPSLTEDDRREILAVHLRGKPLNPQIDIAGLAIRTDGYGGAELASLCRRAGLRAVRRAVASRQGRQPLAAEVRIEPEDFNAAFEGESP